MPAAAKPLIRHSPDSRRFDRYSARTKAALQAAKARGVKLGGLRHRQDGSVVKLDPAAIAAGRAARTVRSAARASDLTPIIADIKATGANSLREIAAELNSRGIPTARGGEWSAVQVQRVMNRGANRARENPHQ